MDKEQLKKLINLISRKVKQEIMEELTNNVKKSIREEIQYALTLTGQSQPVNRQSISESSKEEVQGEPQLHGLKSKLQNILGEQYSDLSFQTPVENKKPKITLRGEKTVANENNIEEIVRMQTKDYSGIMNAMKSKDKKGK